MKKNIMNNPYNNYELGTLRNKNILITGADGMLGIAFKEIINLYIPSTKCFALNKDELNVLDREKILDSKNLNPDYIIHCAALVDADYCEDHEEEAYDIIVNGIKNIIELAKVTGAKVFFPQSFLIFDGKELPITETTTPNPLCVYGKLKLMAERILFEELPQSLVVRMAGFFGGREVDKNFVGKIIPHLAKLIKESRNSIEIGDRIWQPTYTNDLAYNSLLLLSNNEFGIYNMASRGSASFYELSVLIVDTLGIDDRIKLVKVPSVELSKQEKAKRPEIAIMENERLKKEKLDRQRTWQESIVEYLNHPHFKNLFI